MRIPGIHFDFEFGDVILTSGSFGLWPPRRIGLSLFYAGVRKYQAWAFQDRENPDGISATHVRMVMDERLFEVTTPHARFTTLAAAKLHRKSFLVCRHKEYLALNRTAMIAEAGRMNGTPYDYGEIADFLAGAVLGLYRIPVRFFQSRRSKYYVCSSGLLKLLATGGVHVRRVQQPPAFFANSPAFTKPYRQRVRRAF